MKTTEILTSINAFMGKMRDNDTRELVANLQAAFLIALLVFGVGKMLIPSMILFVATFLILRPKLAEGQNE